MDEAIYKALAARTATLATALGLTVSYPNVAFDVPTDDARYLEVKHFPNGTTDFAWNNSPSVHIGIWQVALIDPKQLGSVAALAICDDIAEHFARGTWLEETGTIVKIDGKPSVMGLIQDGHKATYPVSIRYRCSG